jgi:hypothetical protein
VTNSILVQLLFQSLHLLSFLGPVIFNTLLCHHLVHNSYSSSNSLYQLFCWMNKRVNNIKTLLLIPYCALTFQDLCAHHVMFHTYHTSHLPFMTCMPTMSCFTISHISHFALTFHDLCAHHVTFHYFTHTILCSSSSVTERRPCHISLFYTHKTVSLPH